ncbi:CWC16 protein [Schizothecium vesticola]|uniref:Splicing factor YJU2 n=1 Tax=Schizothecium vesticola TaxID=314040 RepID=A0AA40KAT0_9PEZI|nr:CWC16 protein [Schizothecium vesticola]
MSERKVLTKYYPPDFDPSKLERRSRSGPKPTGPKVQVVRLMAPFSMRCTACGEYMYRGRKFNARKETPPDERYMNSIQIFRFYIRCTRCSAEIVFKTDPRNQNYVVERGAKRNTEPWRRGLEGELEESDEKRLDRIEAEMAAAGDEADVVKGQRNAMEELEEKTADARREMAVADALDEIRSRNARVEQGRREGVEVEVGVVGGETEEERRRRTEEEEDGEAARRAFAFVRMQEGLEEEVEDGWEWDEAGPSGVKTDMGPPPLPRAVVEAMVKAPAVEGGVAAKAGDAPAPSFKRQVKKKKDHSALLGIKKKQPLV